MSAADTGNKGAGGPDKITIAAFAMMTIVAGANAVAVRFSNFELPPFWGATLRFASAAAIFWGIALATRAVMPRGRAFWGAVIYGALAFGTSYAFLYWGLVYVQAGVAQISLALAPLMTFFFAIAHGLERFRMRGLLGGLIATAGIALAFSDQLGTASSILPLLALVAAAACTAESGVVAKHFPRTHPAVANAIGMTTGALMLFTLSLIVGETWKLPQRTETWIAYSYLVVMGTVVVFGLFLFILKRWSVSATSYSLVIMPFVTVAIGAWLAKESISPLFALGGALVLLGVWVGALAPSSSRRTEPEPVPAPTSSVG
jgi:drug/metabolite transporter (DMT)-like permease